MFWDVKSQFSTASLILQGVALLHKLFLVVSGLAIWSGRLVERTCTCSLMFAQSIAGRKAGHVIAQLCPFGLAFCGLLLAGTVDRGTALSSIGAHGADRWTAPSISARGEAERVGAGRKNLQKARVFWWTFPNHQWAWTMPSNPSEAVLWIVSGWSRAKEPMALWLSVRISAIDEKGMDRIGWKKRIAHQAALCRNPHCPGRLWNRSDQCLPPVQLVRYSNWRNSGFLPGYTGSGSFGFSPAVTYRTLHELDGGFRIFPRKCLAESCCRTTDTASGCPRACSCLQRQLAKPLGCICRV